MVSKIGKPKKPIKQSQFEELCNIQCTKEEICSVLEVSEKVLNNWCKETYGCTFSLVFEEKRQGGKTSLRRKQWKLADNNPTMAIWLEKQYLGQRDKHDVDTTSSNRVTIINDLPNSGVNETK